jgi:hypothetical protein
MIQCGRQVTDPVDGFLVGKRFLLHDRDSLFTEVNRTGIVGGPIR